MYKYSAIKIYKLLAFNKHSLREKRFPLYFLFTILYSCKGLNGIIKFCYVKVLCAHYTFTKCVRPVHNDQNYRSNTSENTHDTVYQWTSSSSSFLTLALSSIHRSYITFIVKTAEAHLLLGADVSAEQAVCESNEWHKLAWIYRRMSGMIHDYQRMSILTHDYDGGCQD